MDAKTVVLGSQEHACCSLNAGTLDIKASREFSNTVQKAYVRAKVNAPAQKAGWGFAPRPAVNTPTEPAPTLKVTDTTSATRIDLPILVYETKRKPGLNADGTPAADMLYGDMTKEEITAIPTYMYTRMFAVDSWMVNFDSSDTFFADFRKMATRYFSMGDLEMVILAMIAKFEKKKAESFGTPL